VQDVGENAHPAGLWWRLSVSYTGGDAGQCSGDGDDDINEDDNNDMTTTNATVREERRQ
jgi:hypothetical protein